MDLTRLAEPGLQDMGHFTCGSCGNHCTIDRFEVAGRRFPFGGRCTRFESVGNAPTAPTKPPISSSAQSPHFPARSPATGQRRIGIPRGLTAHWLYPLYATFFAELGLEVALSDVDPAGWLKANSGFCFPMQIAHGAVLDLSTPGIETDLPAAGVPHAQSAGAPRFLSVPHRPSQPLRHCQGVSRGRRSSPRFSISPTATPPRPA